MTERLTSGLRVVCVAGARPNYMKIKPVMDALERRGARSSSCTPASTTTKR